MTDRSTDRTSSPSSPRGGGRRRWVAPRIQDHGSLRTFVRQLSGSFDDGKAPPQGQGGQMQTMNPGGGD